MSEANGKIKTSEEASTEKAGPLRLVYSTGLDENAFSGNLNAYLGISFSKTRFFSVATVSDYVAWSLQRFDKLIVIIADSLKIYNQMVFKERDYETAARATRLSGEQYRTAYLKGIPEDLRNRVDFVLSSELIALPACSSLVGKANFEYRNNDQFHSAVTDMTTFALRGKLLDFFGVNPPTEALDTLGRYFVEELAIICYLTVRSDPVYDVSIFPYPPPDLLVDFHKGDLAAVYERIVGETPAPYKAIQVTR